MKVKRKRIAIAGLAAGMATVQNVRIMDAPSTRAASMSSSGIASTRYWLMKKTPNAVTSDGRTTAAWVPVRPWLGNSMSIGTIASWVGTAMVATTKIIPALLPRKRSLAKE